MARRTETALRPVLQLQDLPGLQGTAGLLTEWLSEADGAGAATVALAALRAVTRPDARLVLVSGAVPLNPCVPAIAGMIEERVVLVRPGSDDERAWAIEQALRCEGVEGVVAWMDRAPERVLRRFQLAVEQGGTRGFLIRPAAVRREKCWGDARFLVQPQSNGPIERSAGWRRVGIEVLAGRGGIAVAGQSVVAEVCDATGHVRLVPPVADPASCDRAAGVAASFDRPR